jgi:hypothetical protein
MGRKAWSHLRSQWIGALALFLAISGGSAYALAGHNTVFSDDIVNRQVKKPDLADASVTSRAFAPTAVAPNAADAAKLGGLPPSTYQGRVSSSCAFGRGISAIDAGGGVTCSSPVSVINVVLSDGGYEFMPPFDYSQLQVIVSCTDPGTQVRFQNTGGQDATLNWMFSQGGTTSTVNASGDSVAAGDGRGFFFTGNGTRLEGQWIFANNSGVTTVTLHGFDGNNFCEFRGTALFAPGTS